MKKVVLAFSGGLDTCFCVKYLTREKGFEVHTITIDTGGFSKQELEQIEQRAINLGVSSHKSVNITQKFYDRCLRYLLATNALKNNTYPLSVSAERVFQAIAVAEHARALGADALAHGSTGAGNDQVRFDMIFNILLPGLEIITPIRDLRLSRQQEIDFLTDAGFEADFTKAQYSINQGLWGTSVGGVETLSSDKPLPEHAWPSQLQDLPPSQISIGFENGNPVVLDGLGIDSVLLIQELNRRGSMYAIGRDMHVGDTIIGIKGRVGFEAPAALMLIKAHHTLEKHTLTKWQLQWKDTLAGWYSSFVHEGLFLEPGLRDIEAFLDSLQQYVNGTVTIRLEAYRFTVLGIESQTDLMQSKFGAYGEMNNAWSGEDVRGFSKINSNALSIWAQTHGSDKLLP